MSNKARKATKPITLRIDKYWLTKLHDIARCLSFEYKDVVTPQDLIREATRRVFVAEDKRNVLRREGVLTEREKFQNLKQLILAQGGTGVVNQ